MAIRAVLLDLDGVLYVEDEPVPGAREAVEALRRRELVLRFVTNTTSRPRRRILERLERLGFAGGEAELVTPAALAVRVCRDRGLARVGKPARPFFATSLDAAGVPAADAAMVGDDVESDVGGALDAGLAGVLVRTGKYRADAARAAGVRPSLVIDSIADLPGAIDQL